jgi:hypothetical protein
MVRCSIAQQGYNVLSDPAFRETTLRAAYALRTLGISILVLSFLQPLIVLRRNSILIEKGNCPATASDRLSSDCPLPLEHSFETVGSAFVEYKRYSEWQWQSSRQWLLGRNMLRAVGGRPRRLDRRERAIRPRKPLWLATSLVRWACRLALLLFVVGLSH